MKTNVRDFTNLLDQWRDKKRLFIEKKQRLVVSCSGGLDSTALLHLFWEIQNEEKNFSLEALHVNFGLRGPDSDADQQFVYGLCLRLGIPLHLKVVSKQEHEIRKGKGIQEWARQVRREFSETLVDQGSIIALAHHMEDLAENVLIRLARGVSPTRIGGIKAWNPPYWRPLLGEHKIDLASYLAHHQIPHREDLSNQSLDYSRNIIRHCVLSELEKLYPRAIRHLASCASDAEDLGAWCLNMIKDEALRHFGKERLWIKTLPRGAARHILATLIQLNAPRHRQLSRDFLDEVIEEIHKPATIIKKIWARDIPGGGRIILEHEKIYIEAIKVERKPRTTIK